jgi:hypothetical protein
MLRILTILISNFHRAMNTDILFWGYARCVGKTPKPKYHFNDVYCFVADSGRLLLTSYTLLTGFNSVTNVNLMRFESLESRNLRNCVP